MHGFGTERAYVSRYKSRTAREQYRNDRERQEVLAFPTLLTHDQERHRRFSRRSPRSLLSVWYEPVAHSTLTHEGRAFTPYLNGIACGEIYRNQGTHWCTTCVGLRYAT